MCQVLEHETQAHLLSFTGRDGFASEGVRQMKHCRPSPVTPYQNHLNRLQPQKPYTMTSLHTLKPPVSKCWPRTFPPQTKTRAEPSGNHAGRGLQLRVPHSVHSGMMLSALNLTPSMKAATSSSAPGSPPDSSCTGPHRATV